LVLIRNHGAEHANVVVREAFQSVLRFPAANSLGANY